MFYILQNAKSFDNPVNPSRPFKKRVLVMRPEVKNRRLQIPTKRYRIGELVRYSPFSRQTIHNYTIMGLIQEVEWTEGGHRLYDESVFERLSKITELKKTKSLSQIRQILNKEQAGKRVKARYLQSENN